MVEASDRTVECNKDLMDFFFKAIWFPRNRVSSPQTITMLNGILRAVTKGFSSSGNGGAKLGHGSGGIVSLRAE